MIKRKKLGQHFLNSNSIAEKIIVEANVTSNDIVYEIGTGLGIFRITSYNVCYTKLLRL